jgi:hypothetical protein
MLFDYTYLLENSDAAYFKSNTMQPGEFIIPIDEKISGERRGLFQILQQSKQRFCLYIPFELTKRDSTFIKEEILQNIVRLLFLPNYLRIEGKYLFFIDKPEEDVNSADVLKNQFESELKKQGINDIIIESLQVASPFDNTSNEETVSFYHDALNKYLSRNGNEESFEELTQKFVFPINFNKKWIVPVSSPEMYQRTIELIKKFESWLATTNSFYFLLADKLKCANKEGVVLKAENKILKFKLETNTSSLKILRDEAYGFMVEVGNLRREIDRLANQINYPEKHKQDTTPPADNEKEELIIQLRKQVLLEHTRGNDILAWYKKEYEILPLWYKKFGHIIKVLTGKRTFKSLFK